MELIQVRRGCQICGSSSANLIFKQKFELPHELHDLCKEYDIVSCNECGFVYDDMESSQEKFNNYYNINSTYLPTFIEGKSFNQNALNFYNEMISPLEPFLKQDTSILDIGCATGKLLYCLNKKGYKNLSGLEPSLPCVEYVNSMGIECYHGDVFTNEIHEKFDCIIATGVLEHVFDVEKTLLGMKSMLKENGILYITVPDAGNYNYIKPYYYFDLEHINHFDVISLGNLFKKFGIAIKHTEQKLIKISDENISPFLGLVGFNSAMQITNHKRIIAEKSLISRDIKSYIDESGKDVFFKNIETLKESKKEIILWGVGCYSLCLFDKGLKDCNIIGIVDSDLGKQGWIIDGIEVKSPESIDNENAIIFVISAVYQHAIHNAINTMKLKNEVLFL